MKKIKDYFKRLLNAILGKTPEINKETNKETEELIYGIFTQDNIERIKRYIQFIESKNKFEEKGEKEFIENRKNINVYRDFRDKLVKRNEMPEELKESVNKNIKLDFITMDREMLGLEDIKNMSKRAKPRTTQVSKDND